MEETERTSENEEIQVKPSKKTTEPGIIYLSRIPTLMGVKKMRHMLSQYGEINKIFLQPEGRSLKFKKKSRGFSEGWIEFVKKKDAKMVAKFLNNSQVGGKKRSRSHDELWNMKYLPKFKWAHLNERLAYEKAVHQQRMRTEISQVKKETSFFIDNLNQSEKMKKKSKKKNDSESKNEDNSEVKNNPDNDREWTFRQRETEEAIIDKKLKNVKQGKVKKAKAPINKGLSKSFLQSIFSGGVNEEDS